MFSCYQAGLQAATYVRGLTCIANSATSGPASMLYHILSMCGGCMCLPTGLH
jgi:hypothetical protein